MFYFYILYNPTIDKYYIGYTSNLEKRLIEHNKSSHKSKFTRNQPGSWSLVYFEEFVSKSLAMKREKEVKSWKNKIRVKELVEQSR